MAKNTTKSDRGAKEPKTPIFCRFDPKTIAAIDEICAASPLQPSRARLIEAAVIEYIERHNAGKKSW